MHINNQVRDADEFENCHIANSINFPMGTQQSVSVYLCDRRRCSLLFLLNLCYDMACIILTL